MTWAIARALAGHALKGLWNWLGGLTFWQIVAGILAIIAIIQHFQLLDARHDRDAYRAQRDYYQAELAKISSKKNEQKAETTKRIEVVKERVRHADGEAKKIERAPLPGNCKTPSEIMGADL